MCTTTNPIIFQSVPPIKIPTAADVKNTPLNYSDNQAKKELAIEDIAVQQHIRQVGTKVDYYELDTKNSLVDPLYDEPIKRKFSKKFILYVYVSWPNPEFMVREDGVHSVIVAQAYMARKEAEDVGLNAPRPGDVMRFWNIPFFNNQGANGRDIEGAGYFFDVIEVKDDGHLFDTPYFVGFKIDIKRRTEFGAERKLLEMCD